jgi:hypothetical protein
LCGLPRCVGAERYLASIDVSGTCRRRRDRNHSTGLANFRSRSSDRRYRDALIQNANALRSIGSRLVEQNDDETTADLFDLADLSAVEYPHTIPRVHFASGVGCADGLRILFAA